MKTAVLQSFRTDDVPGWIGLCLDSVRSWAAAQGADYHYMDDAFFSLAPSWAVQRCAGNLYALTDLCRLEWLRRQLEAGYERVIWADADLLVFAPGLLPPAPLAQGYAFAHELFLHVDDAGKTTPMEGLNNALMVFERGQTMLDAYLNACLTRLRALPPGPVPRTALGPELLKELSRAAPLATLDGVGLFTLAIMQQIAAGGGPLVRECVRRSRGPLRAANLCHFLRNATPVESRGRFDAMYGRAVTRLLDSAGRVLEPA